MHLSITGIFLILILLIITIYREKYENANQISHDIDNKLAKINSTLFAHTNDLTNQLSEIKSIIIADQSNTKNALKNLESNMSINQKSISHQIDELGSRTEDLSKAGINLGLLGTILSLLVAAFAIIKATADTVR